MQRIWSIDFANEFYVVNLVIWVSLLQSLLKTAPSILYDISTIYTTISDFVIQTAIDVFDFATESEERLSVTLSTERVNGGCGVIENGGHVLIGIIIAIYTLMHSGSFDEFLL